jgi:hypothetical protein
MFRLVIIFGVLFFVGFQIMRFHKSPADGGRQAIGALSHGGNDVSVELYDLTNFAQIPRTANTATLHRGAYVYTLTKKEDLSSKKFIVYETDNFRTAAGHQSSPDDAYVRTLTLVPADDERAVRAIRAFHAMRNSGRSEFEIKTPQDRARALQLQGDANHLTAAIFTVGILPANTEVKTKAGMIQKGMTITVSGSHFKHSKVLKDYLEAPLSQCLASREVFYLNGLNVQ